MASTGKARRRLSDARDAAARPALSTSPSAVAQPSSIGALNSLAGLSLSASPPVCLPDGTATPVPEEKPKVAIGATPIPIGKNKKRGQDFKCESCSKIYRHPSCLIKHRWEHTPHWRESSKYVLSKHQQVQLLEAAAILSHLSPSSTSLPEDRSLWPSFLSGGSLPGPGDGVPQAPAPHSRDRVREKDGEKAFVSTTTPNGFTLSSGIGYPISSSVPSYAGRAGSAGPRMHDYSVPANGNVGVIASSYYRDRTTQAAPTPVKKLSVSPSEDSEQESDEEMDVDDSPVPISRPSNGTYKFGVIGRGRKSSVPLATSAMRYADDEFDEDEEDEAVPVKREEEEWDGGEMEMDMD